MEPPIPISFQDSLEEAAYELPGNSIIVSQVEKFLGTSGQGAAIIGPSNSGKSSLAFEVCYSLAQKEPELQAIFIHCQDNSKVVANTVKIVSEGERDTNADDSIDAWDYSILENVFLKRFTTAQHLCWYFGSLHNQPDCRLPSAIVVDDIDKFPSSQGHDPVTTCSHILTVMYDAQQHIMKRTQNKCLLVVTMQNPERALLAPLCRKLGLVMRIQDDYGQHPDNRKGDNDSYFIMREDAECAKLLARQYGNCRNSGDKYCRFVLRPRVLRILSDPE